MDLESLEQRLAGTDNEQKVAALVALEGTLRNSTEVSDADHLTSLLRTALKTSNAHVSFAALSCLPAFFPLLVPSSSSLSDLRSSTASPARTISPSSSAASHPLSGSTTHTLKHAFVALLPLGLDRMGDSKEKVREVAREGLVSAGRAALRLGVTAGTGGKDKEGPWTYLHRIVEELFTGKNAKAREQALHYLLALRNPTLTQPLAPLRPFTPLLLLLLSDSDPTVRALALKATMSIFSAPSVTAGARADLKKELVKRDISKKVQDLILSSLLGGGALERSSSSGSIASDMAVRPSSEAGSDSPSFPKARASPVSSPSRPSPRPLPGRATTSAIPQAHSMLASLPATAFPSDPSVLAGSTTDISPVYIASERDLAGEFEGMRAGFEGKETEHNWMVRDRSVARIRGMLKGRVQDNYLEGFLVGLKSVQEGVLKTASSLRTTVATSALTLISELSNSLGPLFDPFLPDYLSHTLSMAGQTKKLVATSSQAAVTALITNSAYHLKTVQLLWTGMNDKIVLARTFVSAHVGTFVRVHGKASRGAIESSGGLDILEQCLKKGLADPNPIVKENSRKSYWDSKKIWEKMAARVYEQLDPSSRKQLDKADPSLQGKAAGPIVAKVARPSVREMMAKAKAKPVVAESPIRPPTAKESTPLRPPVDRAATSPASPLRRLVPSSRLPRTPSTSTTPAPVRDAKLQYDLDALASPPAPADDLMQFASPFVVADDQDPSSSFDPTPRSTPLSSPAPNRPRNASLVLPVTEKVVDAALRDQAAQAEQAAQRLLELAESDDEGGEEGPPIGPGGLPVEWDGERTASPLPKFQRTPVTRRVIAQDVFEDSPDVRDSGFGGAGKGLKNWWMKRTDHLPLAPPLPPDTAERTQEIASLISSIQSGQIDAAGLRKLSALSKERPMQEEDEESASVLSSPTFKNSVEGGEGGALAFWDEGRKLAKLVDGLESLLRNPQAEDRKDLVLVLFKDLVQNQFPSFSGDEIRVFNLLFLLREDPSRSVIAAVEAIADVLVDQLEPLYGLGTLRSTLESYLQQPQTDAVSRSYALGLRLFGKFFARLPSEVLEEELPKARDLIKKGLNDAKSGDLRRAAVTVLVAAQSVLQDEQRLYLIMEGLAKDQKNLLSYYISKAVEKRTSEP